MRYLIFAGILGAFLWLVDTTLTYPGIPPSTSGTNLLLNILWHPFLAAGWMGLHHSQAHRWEPLSFLGALIICLSFLVYTPIPIGLLTHGSFGLSLVLSPELLWDARNLLAFPGYLLFSIAMVKHKFFPPWTAYALMTLVLFGLIADVRHLEGWVHCLNDVTRATLFLFLASWSLYRYKR